MKKIALFLLVSLVAFSCKNNNGAIPIGLHEVTVKELVHTSAYSYVLVTESGKEQWLAIPQSDIKIGGVYYYQGGMMMEHFESKELKKTFESVLFLEGLSEDKNKLVAQPVEPAMGQKSEEKHTNVNANLKKLDIAIVKAQNGVSIAELYVNKSRYSGEKVKILGVVTKFSPEIMQKNWIHLQDGTESNGKFDLTITTKETAEVGDTLTFEGEIAVDKDFGYGYFYEILLEDAKKVK